MWADRKLDTITFRSQQLYVLLASDEVQWSKSDGFVFSERCCDADLLLAVSGQLGVTGFLGFVHRLIFQAEHDDSR